LSLNQKKKKPLRERTPSSRRMPPRPEDKSPRKKETKEGTANPRVQIETESQWTAWARPCGRPPDATAHRPAHKKTEFLPLAGGTRTGKEMHGRAKKKNDSSCSKSSSERKAQNPREVLPHVESHITERQHRHPPKVRKRLSHLHPLFRAKRGLSPQGTTQIVNRRNKAYGPGGQ